MRFFPFASLRVRMTEKESRMTKKGGSMTGKGGGMTRIKRSV